MKIAVIAAGGRSGQAFVEAALAAGHSVRAGTLHTNHLKAHPKLSIMTCDATVEADMENLFQGQDAVASFIGHVKGSTEDVQTVATQNAVNVMQRMGIRRFVSLTGTGVRSPGDKIPLMDRLLNLAVFTTNPTRVWDGKRHVDVLRKSAAIDWTVIRVLILQDSQPRPFELLEHGPPKWLVSREESAQAALQVLEQGSFIHQMPIIGKPTRQKQNADAIGFAP